MKNEAEYTDKNIHKVACVLKEFAKQDNQSRVCTQQCPVIARFLFPASSTDYTLLLFLLNIILEWPQGNP